MKKRIFSLMALALFMVSTVNLNANTQKEVIDNPDCWELADQQVASYERSMGLLHKIPSHYESFKVWEAAYLGCI